MIVPTVKTLVTYIRGAEIKRVLSNFKMGDDKYALIEYQNNILSRCPFEADYKHHEEIHKHHRAENSYSIIYYNYQEPIEEINVIVNYVLEFDGKIFMLQEEQYDMIEFDY